MNVYILDDDMNIVKILQKIVVSDFGREVVGMNTDPVVAIEEILTLKPDALIVDYLMPFMDGADVIRKVKAVLPSIAVVMISQVNDKGMIGEAYSEGLSFFISKPINKIEVNAVLKNLQEQLEAEMKLKQIMNLIGQAPPVYPSGDNKVDLVKNVFMELGIYSEKGTKDMIAMAGIMVNENVRDWTKAFEHYCKREDEGTKIVRQRMRRAATKALRNMAYLGLEDNLNNTFVKYAHTLFDFETVKHEMDYLRGTSINKGSLSIDRFMDNVFSGQWE